MSRNKENNPLPSSTRANGSILAKTPPSEDFFTDSLLDASRIPSPSPQKAFYGKPRRAIVSTRALQLARGSVNSSHRSSPNQKDATTPARPPKTSSEFKKSDNLTPTADQSLVTPPPSRHGIEVTSPRSDVSSPPRGLTDVYQRIADEEDLAATEGELDDEDEDEEDLSGDFGSGIEDNANQDLANGQNGASSQNSHGSRATTPVQYISNDDKENVLDEKMDIASQASGMSFLEQMTDQSLAAKLTPHTIDHARNRQRLTRSQGVSSGPISFKLGPPPSNTFQNQDWTNRSDENAKPAKANAFKYAGAQIDFGFTKPQPDTSRRPSPPKAKAFTLAQRQASKPMTQQDDDDGSDTPDELRNVERKFALSRIARILKKSKTTDSQNDLSKESRLKTSVPEEPQSPTFSRSTRSDRSQDPVNSNQIRGMTAANGSLAGNQRGSLQQQYPQGVSNLPQPRQRIFAEQQSQDQQREARDDSSQVDWAAAAADVPLPSVENSVTPQGTPLKAENAESTRAQKSIDKVRKWENDFTGMSFQVSESPPVRAKPVVNDQTREREIARLAKQALTTNRLEEIREKSPQELQRKTSNLIGNLNEINFRNDNNQDTQESVQELEDEKMPDTPVVVFRSSSSASGRNSDREGISRPQHDRQTSHDYLQRLARATSTTPRSSPVPALRDDGVLPETDDNSAKYEKEHVKDAKTEDKQPQNVRQLTKESLVAATPKISGAWTDTILPDTIKTARIAEKIPKYTQTPHVSAGGWIDTPKLNGYRQSSAMAPMTIEEETEDFTMDVVPSAEGQDIVRVPSPEKEIYIPQKAVPRSALSSILDQQRLRLASQDITTARDDTLNLGDATIASLEDLVTLDETEMTTLMRMGMDQEVTENLADEGLDQKAAEAQLLERLGIKLERLRTNIHVAKKGISKLEHQVSHPVEAPLTVPQTAISNSQGDVCSICGQIDLFHSHKTSSVFPLVYSTFTLPIPLLFYPRKPGQKGRFSLPQPTTLGWVTIAGWIWYLLESTMCELYSHPTHAEHYVWPTRPEPEFPFVLPTVISRWVGVEFLSSSFLTPIWRIIVAFGRVIGMFFGWTDGFVDDQSTPGFVAEASKLAVKMATSVASAAAETDLSMMNDDFM